MSDETKKSGPASLLAYARNAVMVTLFRATEIAMKGLTLDRKQEIIELIGYKGLDVSI